MDDSQSQRRDLRTPMDVLVIGDGPVGLTYAMTLDRCSHRVDVLTAHDDRPPEILFEDWGSGDTPRYRPRWVLTVRDRDYDLVLVAVGRDRIPGVINVLRTLTGTPHILVLGHLPDGHQGFPDDLLVQLGFPGVIAKNSDDRIVFARLLDTPTMLEESRVAGWFSHSIGEMGFPRGTTRDIDGYLAHRCVIAACLGRTVLNAGRDPKKLAWDWAALGLMTRAMGEAFAALQQRGTGDAPKLLSLLSRPALAPLGAFWWSREFRSTSSQVTHCAFAQEHPREVSLLSDWTLAMASDARFATPNLIRLLTPQPRPSQA